MEISIVTDSHNTVHYCILSEAFPGDHSGAFTYFFHHREDGPAIIYKDSSYLYMVKNKEHRYNGPAMHGVFRCYKTKNIKDYYVWFLYGKELTPQEAKEYRTWLKEMGLYKKKLTDVDKAIIDMKWKPIYEGKK